MNLFSFVKKDDTGKMLYTRVCEFMHLEEKDYFGLTFLNNENTRVSLDSFIEFDKLGKYLDMDG